MAGSFFLIDLIVVMPEPKLTFHHHTAQKTRKMASRGDFSEEDVFSGNETGGQPVEESSTKRRKHGVRVDMVQVSCNWGLPRAIQ